MTHTLYYRKVAGGKKKTVINLPFDKKTKNN